jgi:hypothetical protein
MRGRSLAPNAGRAREARMKSWLFRWYGTDYHGRNNASSRCQERVCNESDCWPDTYWRQPLPHVTLPGSLARPARHLLARGLGRGEVRFRRSENALRCIPAPLLPYSTLVIENRSGGGTNIATEAVVRARLLGGGGLAWAARGALARPSRTKTRAMVRVMVRIECSIGHGGSAVAVKV